MYMQLPDKRLYPVMDKFIDRISQKQSLSIRKLANARKEEIQFGRFLGNQRVSFTHFQSYLYDQLTNHCKASEVLLIEDTSQIGFGLNKAIAGLGKVDKGQIKGFYLHPVLCLDAYNGACYGIASLQLYKRKFEAIKKNRKEAKAQCTRTPYEQKEGYQWYIAIEDALKQLPIECQRKTVIADREADIYALLSGLKHDLQLDYVIRSKHNRPLGEGSALKETIASWDQQYSYTTHVSATDKRSAHEALLHIKFGKVELKKAEGKTLKNYPQTLTTWVVEAAESVVGKEDPIERTLFTSHAVEDIGQALQIISWYKVEMEYRTII